MSITLWNLPISDDHLQSIGWIATSWSLLDGAIDFGIWSVLGIDELEGRSITSNMSFPQRINSLNSLGSQALHSPSELKEFSSIINRIKQAQAKRNQILHAEWSSKDNYWTPPKPRTATAHTHNVKKGRLVIGAETYAPKELNEIGNNFSNVGSDLKIFILNRFTYQNSRL